MAWHQPLQSGNTANSQLEHALRAVTQTVDATVQLIGEVTAVESDLPRGWLSARDRELETVHVFALRLANLIEAISRRTEREWLRANGGPALPRLLATIGRLRALRDACNTLRPLLRAQFAKAHRNAHLPSRAVIESMAALDAVAVTDVETDLASVLWHLDCTLSKLERVVDAAGGLGDGILAAPTNH